MNRELAVCDLIEKFVSDLHLSFQMKQPGEGRRMQKRRQQRKIVHLESYMIYVAHRPPDNLLFKGRLGRVTDHCIADHVILSHITIAEYVDVLSVLLYLAKL